MKIICLTLFFISFMTALSLTAETKDFQTTELIQCLQTKNKDAFSENEHSLEISLTIKSKSWFYMIWFIHGKPNENYPSYLSITRFPLTGHESHDNEIEIGDDNIDGKVDYGALGKAVTKKENPLISYRNKNGRMENETLFQNHYHTFVKEIIIEYCN